MLTLEHLARQEWPYLFVICSGLLLALYRFRPDERRNVGLTLLYLMLGAMGLWFSSGLAGMGFPQGGAVLREIFTILLGLIIIRLFGLALFRLLLRALGVEPPRILEDVLVMLGYLAWGLVRLRYAGLDLSQLVTTSAVITAVVAFAMQDTLGNILSGIALQLDDSLQLGQWVKLHDYSGKVLQVGWRSTLIETRNGETVVIPNAWLMKNSFQVIGKRFNGHGLEWRRWVWLDIAWDHPPSMVIALMQQAVQDAHIAGVSTEPPPGAVLMEARDGIARYAMRYWMTDFAQDDPTDSQVRAHLITALVRHGIPLASPSHNVLMTKDNDKTAAQRQETDISRRLRALECVSLFNDFTDEERRHLAEQLRFAPFESGDVISRQGAVAHWLYILTLGEVDVWRNYQAPGADLLGHLKAGGFFGEMGLMTGAPRTATVVAATYVECYRLDRAGFEAILTARPALADALSRILAERLAENQLHARDLATVPVVPHQAEVLDRIRRFFGL
ncbi:mechanosensitive ion channel protein MscS [Chitinimonas prasina]|uniref:Small-conductance mechanosensitive channel n=1 Tax=Chitinimonas prasina TaxID=1434937 RepID=A0ABQ5Y9X6_9NEIS|nr:mechanosensitive ion channel family protein [Chitinimonas prasina]GLR11263.1 mechanosensitive ion channel protein MscS [Chitinimonas prasina]